MKKNTTKGSFSTSHQILFSSINNYKAHRWLGLIRLENFSLLRDFFDFVIGSIGSTPKEFFLHLQYSRGKYAWYSSNRLFAVNKPRPPADYVRYSLQITLFSIQSILGQNRRKKGDMSSSQNSTKKPVLERILPGQGHVVWPISSRKKFLSYTFVTILWKHHVAFLSKIF